jgi:hypothetical protein
MNGSAAAYVSAEAAGQTLMSAAAAPAQALFGGGAVMVTGQAAPTVAQSIGSFGAAVAAPYQQLVINTNNNLAAINQTFMANPFPFANQVIINQAGFANTFGAGLATSLRASRRTCRPISNLLSRARRPLTPERYCRGSSLSSRVTPSRLGRRYSLRART